MRLQFEKEGGEPGINGDIQDAEEDATVPEEDEEKFIVLEKEKLIIPTEAEDEEELQEDIAKSELDRLDELRLELCCDRRSYAMRVSAIWFFQVTFSILIILEADFKISELEVPTLKIGFTRLIAGMIMHVIVCGEISNGLKMMKYAANHWWKFSNPRLAWLTGFLQASALVLIAFINYLVVTVSDNVLDVAKDFTALLIISEFDDILADLTTTY